MIRFAILAAFCLWLGGCGAVALPCRVTAAAIDVVPAVGHPVASPFNGCADVIDHGG